MTFAAPGYWLGGVFALLLRLATRVVVLLMLGLGAWMVLADTASADDGPSPSPSPGAKARPYPFNSVIFSFDPESGALRIGKNRIRLVFLTSNTRMLLEDGGAATWDDLIDGTAVRGSIRKREDGELEVISMTVGTKSQTPP